VLGVQTPDQIIQRIRIPGGALLGVVPGDGRGKRPMEIKREPQVTTCLTTVSGRWSLLCPGPPVPTGSRDPTMGDQAKPLGAPYKI
jgi:hypothetical protein